MQTFIDIQQKGWHLREAPRGFMLMRYWSQYMVVDSYDTECKTKASL